MNKELLSKCLYPLTRSIMNEKCLIIAFYRCNNSIPNFDTTKLVIKESNTLKTYKISDNILNTIDIIEKYQHNFYPSIFDRFIFEKNGIKLFSMINIDTNQERRATLIRL